MGSTEERKKQRWQYLKKKGAAYTKASLAGLLALPFALIALLLLIVALFALYSFVVRLPVFEPGDDPIGISLLFLVLAFILGTISWLFARWARRSHREAKQLPYVPPVTSDILPAEEVLVRASEEPVQQQSKVLLRGIDASAGTGEQELLRSSQG